jgi:hypothetical protein
VRVQVPPSTFEYIFVNFSMGALTSKPFSFTARSWELTDRITYDYSDTIFSALKVNFRGNSIIRILPEISSESLSEWISDRTRFSYDSLTSAKSVDKIYDFEFNLITNASLQFFFKRFFTLSQAFGSLDISSAIRLKNFSFFLGTSFYANPFSDFRNVYYKDFSDLSLSFLNYQNFFLIGLNLRYSLPIFSISIRKLNSQALGPNIFNLGFYTNNLFSELNIGCSKSDLFRFLNSSSRLSRFFYKNLFSAVILTNPSLGALVGKKLRVFSNVHSFFSKPTLLAYFETGFFNFYTKNVINFSLPHPFKVIAYNLRSSSYQKFDSLFSSFFYGNTLDFFGKRIGQQGFFYRGSPFCYSIREVFGFSNFYTYFFDRPGTSSSLNILISAKRNIESRSSFNYYT